MRSEKYISAPSHRYSVEITDPERKEQTHGNVLATEDLHETKEHMPLDGSRKRI